MTENDKRFLAGAVSGIAFLCVMGAGAIVRHNSLTATGNTITSFHNLIDNATIVNLTHVNFDAANVDGLTNVASLRTLGPLATQAAPGNDARLSDRRAPTSNSVESASIQTNSIQFDRLAATITNAQSVLGLMLTNGALSADSTGSLKMATGYIQTNHLYGSTNMFGTNFGAGTNVSAWFVILPGHICMSGGRGTNMITSGAQDNTQTQVMTFAMPFASTNYVVTLGAQSAVAGAGAWSYYNTTTGNFTIILRDLGGTDASGVPTYHAVGPAP